MLKKRKRDKAGKCPERSASGKTPREEGTITVLDEGLEAYLNRNKTHHSKCKRRQILDGGTHRGIVLLDASHDKMGNEE